MIYPDVFEEVQDEVRNARAKFGPMRGPHEGYAVLLEEVDELWDAIKAKEYDPARAREEAIQVAAMAICFIAEVTP